MKIYKCDSCIEVKTEKELGEIYIGESTLPGIPTKEDVYDVCLGCIKNKLGIDCENKQD